MIILDTSVVSELMKGDPFPTVFAWASGYPPGDLFTTAITMSEVLYGIERLPRGKRRDQLLGEAESVFVEDFAGRILAFDESSARDVCGHCDTATCSKPPD